MTQRKLRLSPLSPTEILYQRVTKTEGCWTITAARTNAYGTVRGMQAHRYSWIAHNGPIPDGMYVLHRCDNPQCVRPSHLYLGTALDNARDREERGRHGAAGRQTFRVWRPQRGTAPTPTELATLTAFATLGSMEAAAQARGGTAHATRRIIAQLCRRVGATSAVQAVWMLRDSLPPPP